MSRDKELQGRLRGESLRSSNQTGHKRSGRGRIKTDARDLSKGIQPSQRRLSAKQGAASGEVGDAFEGAPNSLLEG